jgi:hypothetical protein
MEVQLRLPLQRVPLFPAKTIPNCLVTSFDFDILNKNRGQIWKFVYRAFVSASACSD